LSILTRKVTNCWQSIREYGLVRRPDSEEDTSGHAGNPRAAENWRWIMGICEAYWENIKHDILQINSVLQNGCMGVSQRTGIIVCIPKTGSPKSARHSRPITLLNVDAGIITKDCDHPWQI
jgi:hypothetical protein